MKSQEKNITPFEIEVKRSLIKRPFQVMVKACGPVCNLDCDYCYYLDKLALFEGKRLNVSEYRMSDEVLEKLVKDFIKSQPQKQVDFVWHGGEPTLLGIDYFKKIIELQQKYAEDKAISNAIQTNGTLINDEWCDFLVKNDFLCGISIDGPKCFHDIHRRDYAGNGSWQKAVDCIKLFQKHGVKFNAMCVINSENSKQPAAVYNFLKNLGVEYMQFSPICERIATDEHELFSVVTNDYQKDTDEMSENVSAKDFGNFLCRIFDLWVKQDVGKIYVNYFDNTLAAYMNQNPSLCSMDSYCGCSLAVEHNGDVFCCDHFVFPEYRLGNVLQNDISDLAKTNKQLFFEERKKNRLSKVCQSCEFLFVCGGDCPKNRFQETTEGESISALCEGFTSYFEHTRRYFEFMANELKNHRAPANVMKAKNLF